ncbi:hypothetical protein ANN_02778 [Periplaneta americana]|uniref:Uncharacterized protein n=1 Tax=Periplaneta americana TaxID=6978 RepID=A0ABQ8TX71_PERAM|nr:hypothetical protein ANN_02778 [Periplaneta americana]
MDYGIRGTPVAEHYATGLKQNWMMLERFFRPSCRKSRDAITVIIFAKNGLLNYYLFAEDDDIAAVTKQYYCRYLGTQPDNVPILNDVFVLTVFRSTGATYHAYIQSGSCLMSDVLMMSILRFEPVFGQLTKKHDTEQCSWQLDRNHRNFLMFFSGIHCAVCTQALAEPGLHRRDGAIHSRHCHSLLVYTLNCKKNETSMEVFFNICCSDFDLVSSRNSASQRNMTLEKTVCFDVPYNLSEFVGLITFHPVSDDGVEVMLSCWISTTDGPFRRRRCVIFSVPFNLKHRHSCNTSTALN